jgi:hypothetical protein
MLFAEIITGVILIFCGLLVKKYPSLIAGYNSMTAEEKKKIDIKKFSTFLHNGLIITGALLIIAAIILFLLNIKDLYKLTANAIIIVFGLLFTLMNAPKN